MCIDYRQLNKQRRLDSHPLPRIDEIFDRLLKARYFTKIDLVQGYHQIQIENGHEFKTAFQCRYSTYEITAMLLGLTNAPATFQHLMNVVFHNLLDDFVIMYLDDILIYSATWAEHMVHVEQVLSR